MRDEARADSLDEVFRPLEHAKEAMSQVMDQTGQFVLSLDPERRVLTATPLDVDQALAQVLWKRKYPQVLISGTLAVQGSFRYPCSRLGITRVASRDVQEFTAASPFDYAGRMRIYVPRSIPEPSWNEEEDQAFVDALAEEIRHIILKITGGRTLVLFTSYRRLKAVRNLLLKQPLPCKLLRQEKGVAAAQLLQSFREDETSVLLATGAFWQGVDVQGDSLTCVVIDKLPFPSPSEPVLYGLHQRVLNRTGGDQKAAMDEVDLPTMLLQLRQGTGRLIRHEEDWGIVAIMDRRVMRSRYLSAVQAALPPAPWVRSMEELTDWYAGQPARDVQQGHAI